MMVRLIVTPSAIELNLDAPKTVRPREDLVIDLSCNTKSSVLLCVRDERLTATDTPAVALGAAAKRGVDSATADMSDEGFTSLAKFVEPPVPSAPMFGFDEPDVVLWGGLDDYYSWNLYRGDLGLLRASEDYTQEPGSSPQALRLCSLPDTSPDDSDPLPVGMVAFYLVSGNIDGYESGLGVGCVEDLGCP